MGFTPVNKITITREFSPRKIVVRWHDDVTGDGEKEFEFRESAKAVEFALSKFTALAM